VIQQKVELQLILVGDGTSTSFAFDLGRVYGLYFPPGPEVEGPTSGSIAPLGVLNSDAIPDGVVVDFAKLPDQTNLPGTVSVSVSHHIIYGVI
jgi:hypothetical protein